MPCHTSQRKPWIPWNLSFRYISFHEKRLQAMLWHHYARVNSHQRWKQTRFRVCFHLWCELTITMNLTEWQVSWYSWAAWILVQMPSPSLFFSVAAKFPFVVSRYLLLYLGICWHSHLTLHLMELQIYCPAHRSPCETPAVCQIENSPTYLIHMMISTLGG